MVEYPKLESVEIRFHWKAGNYHLYHQQEYLLASGLMSEEVSEKTETVLWSLLEMRPDQPESWKAVSPHARVQTYRNLIDVTTTEPGLLACCTTEFM